MESQQFLNVVVFFAGFACVLGGFAVLAQCERASTSWRALSGMAVSLVGAVGVWDSADGYVDIKLAIAVCGLAVPVSNVLWKAWHHIPMRRVTDLAMFDDQPHHHQ